MKQNQNIAIIGAGASGTILALHLVDIANDPLHLHIIDKAENVAKGLAYTPENPCFILNVPANKMGAYPDRPAHFYEWLQTHGDVWRSLHADFESVQYGPEDFLPRMIYAAYLGNLLNRAAENPEIQITHYDSYASIIKHSHKQMHVTLDNAQVLTSDAAVLATGNSKARKLAPLSDNVYASPYEAAFLQRDWNAQDHVLIAGTGLSMIDVIAFLSRIEFKGRITAFSRRALTPLSHVEHFDPIDPVLTKINSVSDTIRTMRAAIKTQKPWPAAIDSLRPISSALWQELSEKTQRQIARIMPWWNIARHRIPKAAYQRLENMKASSQLTVMKSRLQTIVEEEGVLNATFENDETLQATALVHCAGFDYRASALQTLCPDIPLQTHWTGGVSPVKNGSFQVAEAAPLYALGPVLQGAIFESTAVNEIRIEAAALAKELLA